MDFVFIEVGVSGVGGNAEVVAEGKTGLLAPARDARALASSLQRLLADSTLRDSLGSAGRQRVESEFSLDKMVQSYLDCYRGGP